MSLESGHRFHSFILIVFNRSRKFNISFLTYEMDLLLISFNITRLSFWRLNFRKLIYLLVVTIFFVFYMDIMLEENNKLYFFTFSFYLYLYILLFCKYIFYFLFFCYVNIFYIFCSYSSIFIFFVFLVFICL